MTKMTFGVLQQIAQSETGLARLTLLFNDVANAQFHGTAVEYLLRLNRLFVLLKPNGKPRPIGAGEVITRAVSGLLARHFAAAISAASSNSQFGFGIPGGIERAIALGQDLIRGGHAVLKLDIRNAFCTVLRHHLLSYTKQRIPALFPFVNWLYGQQTVYMAQTGKRMFWSLNTDRGVIQGDPLAAPLFQLALASLCEEATKSFPLAAFIFYADDIHAFSTPEELLKFHHWLGGKLTSLGLELNNDKCILMSSAFTPDQAAAAQAAHITTNTQGITLLGTPVIPPSGFETTFLKDSLEEKTTEVLNILNTLDDVVEHLNPHLFDAQCLLNFIRATIPPMFTSLARTLPPSLVEPYGQRVHARIAQIVHKLAQNPSAAGTNMERLAEQISLPAKFGGLSLTNTALIAKAAMVASRLLTWKENLPTLLQHAAGKSPDVLLLEIPEFASSVKALHQLLKNTPNFENLGTLKAILEGDFAQVRLHSLAHAQRVLTRQLRLAHRDQFATTLAATTTGPNVLAYEKALWKSLKDVNLRWQTLNGSFAPNRLTTAEIALQLRISLFLPIIDKPHSTQCALCQKDTNDVIPGHHEIFRCTQVGLGTRATFIKYRLEQTLRQVLPNATIKDEPPYARYFEFNTASGNNDYRGGRADILIVQDSTRIFVDTTSGPQAQGHGQHERRSGRCGGAENRTHRAKLGQRKIPILSSRI